MDSNWGHRCWRGRIARARGLLGMLSVGVALFNFPALAQIVPDTTLGTQSSQVNPDVNIRGLPGDRIDGGAVRGSSLFHSFSDFNVNDGQRVYFSDPAGIANIFSRVTGANVSNILGTLGVDGAANLFLLNPNGFIFGSNAQMDIQGSLMATTGDRFIFPNGIEFSTTNPHAPPLLSISAPIGVQYGSQPGTIVNTGNLTVGQDLTFTAGNLDLQNQLHAGRDLTLLAQDTVQVRDSAVNPFIASAGGTLVVQGNQAVDIVALSHPNSGFFSGGDMVLRSANTVGGDAHYTSGGTFRIEQLDGSLGNLFSPGDPIILSGGDVRLGDYTGGSLHILSAGNVTLGNVMITGTDSNTIHPNNTTLFNNTQTIASLANFTLADGTPITIQGNTTPTLDVRAGVNWNTLGGFPVPEPTVIGSVTLSPGTILASGASITVNGTITNTQPNGLVLLTNQFQPNRMAGNIVVNGISTICSSSSGNIGSIIIDSRGDFIPLGNLETSTTGTGHSGDIRIQAVGDVRLDGVSFKSSGMGDVGDISIAARSLSLTNGAQLITSASGQGNAGDVRINVQGAVTIAGLGSSNSLSLITTNLQQGAVGQRGNIFITAGSFSLADGALLSTNSFGQGNAGDIRINVQGAITLAGLSGSNSPSLITSTLQQGAVGQGGNIFLTSDSLTLADRALVSTSTSGQGNAGNVFVQALGNVSLANSNIFSDVEAGGQGNGGLVEIKAGSLSLTNGAQVSTKTSGQGNAGNVFVQTLGNVSLANTNTAIFSRGESNGIGNAGSIDINAVSFSLADGAQVMISSRFPGQAGNIAINANRATLNNNAKITAETVSGNGGNINLTIGEKLSLSNGSEISTQAGSQFPPRSGDGGVITINVKDGLVIAMPTENSDILASAFGRRGGTVNINARQVLGLRSSPQRLTPDQLQSLRSNSISETNASLGSGFEGTIELNTLNTKPSQTLAELTSNLINPRNLIARGCGSIDKTSASRQSEFVVTGRGGLPLGPNEPQTSGAIEPQWVSRDVGSVSRLVALIEPPSPVPTTPLIEAQGMVMNGNGELVLTAQAPTVTPHQSGFPAKLCQQ